MNLVARLVENHYQSGTRNPHGLNNPAGVWLTEQGKLWVTDRNNNRVVGIEAGKLDQVIPTKGHPTSVAQAGINLLVASSDWGGLGKIIDLRPDRISSPRILEGIRKVNGYGRLGYSVHDDQENVCVSCVVMINDRAWIRPADLEIKKDDATTLTRYYVADIAHTSTGVYLLGRYRDERTDRSQKDSSGKDYILKWDKATKKPTIFAKFATPVNEFLATDGTNLVYHELGQSRLGIIDTTNSKGGKITFPGGNPLQANNSQPLTGLALRKVGEKHLLAVSTSYHVGTYELNQE